jgi:hypothetical protein
MGWQSDLVAGVGMGTKLNIIKGKSDLHTIKSYLTLTLVCSMSCLQLFALPNGRLEETWRAMAFVLCVSSIEDEEARRFKVIAPSLC